MHRGEDTKRQSLLRFELFRKIDKFLSLNLRNILISPFEGEKKFLSELRGLRNFREGDNLKYSCPVQHETVIEPSPAFVMLTKVRKRLLPLTKREGSDSVIISNFFDTNHSQLTTHNSLIPDIVFSRFTSSFLHKRTAFTLAEVLITLGIIGIVAALTLPVIISDVKNSQLEAGLKKAYSVLGQALNMYQAENGERIIAGDATNRRMIKSYLMQYIKSAKGINDDYCSNTSTYNMNGAGCTNSALMNKNFFKKLPR